MKPDDPDYVEETDKKCTKKSKSKKPKPKANPYFDDEHTLRSMILYISIQEIARQVSVMNKDLGFMLLKVFKQYFEQNEQVWLGLIHKCKTAIDTLKTDRKILMTAHDMPDDLEDLLQNDKLTKENLMAHKQMIKKLVGKVHDAEDRSFISQLEKKHIDEEVRSWIWEWDRIRISSKVSLTYF